MNVTFDLQLGEVVTAVASACGAVVFIATIAYKWGFSNGEQKEHSRWLEKNIDQGLINGSTTSRLSQRSAKVRSDSATSDPSLPKKPLGNTREILK